MFRQSELNADNPSKIHVTKQRNDDQSQEPPNNSEIPK